MDYWKIRARTLLIENVRLEATIEIMKRQAALADTLRAAGLDPVGNYEMNDDTETVTPRTA